jgi:hypothetical protein
MSKLRTSKRRSRSTSWWSANSAARGAEIADVEAGATVVPSFGPTVDLNIRP